MTETDFEITSTFQLIVDGVEGIATIERRGPLPLELAHTDIGKIYSSITFDSEIRQIGNPVGSGLYARSKSPGWFLTARVDS